MPKSPEYIISIIAVWMRGAAFLPIASDLPELRINTIIKDASPNVIIDKNNEILFFSKKTHLDESIRYIFYTSGSTGFPKGVMIPEVGILNFLDAQIKMFKINSCSRSLFYLSTQFDASISDIGCALLSGATLCIETDDNVTMATQLASITHKRQITHLDIPPSLLAILDVEKMSNTLETIIIGGEVCSIEVIKKWSKKYRVVNVYGPTEATVCTSMKLCDVTWTEPSIGKPIANIEYRILEGERGELLISGIGLAKGYLNNKALSEQKFIHLEGKKYYRTGDLVKRNLNGEYVFLGRLDRQIKIRGQLVAPEEIEATLLELPGVKKAAVISMLSGKFKKSIIAFVEGEVSAFSLADRLKERLPAWMQPSKIIILSKMPITVTGKIEYALLKKEVELFLDNELVGLSNDQNEREFQEIWKEILKLKSFPGTNKDFFCDLGGDSLAAVEMILQAEKKGFIFPIGILSQHRTISKICFWLKKEKNYNHDVLLTTILKEEALANEINGNEKYSFMRAGKKKYLFLTGATGFLGIHVLKELLKQTSFNILCLARDNDLSEALARLLKVAQKYQIDFSKIELSRIVPIIGSLSEPNLGIDNKIFEKIAGEIDAIFHCGAIVNLFKSFEELKQVNLRGTQELVRLAKVFEINKLHIVSTLSVLSLSEPYKNICYEDDFLENTTQVHGGYAQSKWAAEYFLHKIPRDPLKINIFRLGLITGNCVKSPQKSTDHLSLFIKSVAAIKAVPHGDWEKLELDVTPVDYAAKAMVYLSRQSDFQCYHIANSSRFSLKMLIESLAKHNIMVEKITSCDWVRLVQNLKISKEDKVTAFMSLGRLIEKHLYLKQYKIMDLFEATGHVFDQRNTQHALKSSGIICPEANEDLLNQYILRIL